jgi:hypothetical protein
VTGLKLGLGAVVFPLVGVTGTVGGRTVVVDEVAGGLVIAEARLGATAAGAAAGAIGRIAEATGLPCVMRATVVLMADL